MSGYLTDIANVTATPSAPPTAIAPSTTSSATATQTIAADYEIQPGDSCLAIELLFNLPLARFIAWNPEVNAGCTNIEVGLSYCVFGLTEYTPTPISIPPSVTIPPPTSASLSSTSSSTTTSPSGSPLPSNIASGTITSGCNQYYTIVSGDSCTAIESNFGITINQFVAWNPEVNVQSPGTNIDVGLAYCVSGPTVSTTTSPTTSPTGVPIAPGTITTGCAQYYPIQSGDDCSTIDSKFKISLAQFLAWNTGVNAKCATLLLGSNLLLGFQYCVSGPSVSSTSTSVTTSAAPTASGTT
ncbi:hypothetical protein EIP86_009019 [Pleurotus ostreatoroseus]|nr:hypothetical protein EIP86_009019 [Pleurotus ostreatoroseus]